MSRLVSLCFRSAALATAFTWVVCQPASANSGGWRYQNADTAPNLHLAILDTQHAGETFRFTVQCDSETPRVVQWRMDFPEAYFNEHFPTEENIIVFYGNDRLSGLGSDKSKKWLTLTKSRESVNRMYKDEKIIVVNLFSLLTSPEWAKVILSAQTFIQVVLQKEGDATPPYEVPTKIELTANGSTKAVSAVLSACGLKP